MSCWITLVCVTATPGEVQAIERALAENLSAYVSAYRVIAPELGASALEIAGGVAAFCGPDSPLTTVKGVGAQLSANDCERVEAFFRDCGARAVTVECAPYVNNDSRRVLEECGYGESSQEHVLVRRQSVHGQSAFNVEPLPAAEWPDVMRRAFELPETPAMQTLVRAAGELKGARLWGLRDEGVWVACAQRVRYGNVVIFGCDGTLPEARGRGAQGALILERLRDTAPEVIVTAEVAPGSVSERNYLRCGFEIAYARTHYTRTLH